MDRKINKQIETYFSTFKKQLNKKIVDMQIEEPEKVQDLVEYVYGYDRLVLSKEDVSKRKRIKNAIPFVNRCHAKRANDEQCTRKQKEGHLYCGTHVKGTPHGIICQEVTTTTQLIKSEVFAEDIGGIIFYLDKQNNVFKTEDVLNDCVDPKVIAQYVLEDNKYKIPAFGLC